MYRNLGTGRFVDVTERLGPPASIPTAGRGAAFGDLDDDGDIDIVVNNVHDRPDVFRTESQTSHRWLTVRLVGTTSNRSAIGARVRVVAGDLTLVDEVRGGGSYLSQNDLRVHVGLGDFKGAVRVDVRWPNGNEERWEGIETNRIVALTEGGGQHSARP